MPEGRRLVLEASNATGWRVPGATVTHLFEAQVRRAPSATAVIPGPETGPDRTERTDRADLAHPAHLAGPTGPGAGPAGPGAGPANAVRGGP